MSDSQPTLDPNRGPNPYVGPRPFEAGERLYGRGRETLDLYDLLIAERIVLLHSPSGAGKTSLLQAALLPRLQDKRFRVLPIVRVHLNPLPNAPTANRYVMSALIHLEHGVDEDAQRSDAELAALSLHDYLVERGVIPRSVAAPDDEDFDEDVEDDAFDAPAERGRPLQRTILIFDQFEEVLTVDATDRTAKAEFFAQLGEVLAHRHIWAIFALREDYVAPLAPYLRPLPTRLQTRFRLDLLDTKAAIEAIQEPAREKNVKFTDAAAEKLTADLATVREQTYGSDEVVEKAGAYIEPVQLQVVCENLWTKPWAAPDTIDVGEIESVGDVDAALATYYANAVKKATEKATEKAAAQTGVAERAIRTWFDERLITGQNIRGQVLRGPDQGLPDAAIDALVDAYLVRREERRGLTWFELAHDRLVGPVREDNARWFETNLSTLQRQAALWRKENRPDGLLLRGDALVKAEAWAETQPELEEYEADFLDKSREERQRVEREARQNRLIRWLAVGAAIIATLALIATWFAFRQTQIATARGLITESRLQIRNRDIRLATLLALEAEKYEPGEAQRILDDEIPANLFPVVTSRTLLGRHGDWVLSVAWSPDGRTLASGSRDETIKLWVVDREGGGVELLQTLKGHENSVNSVAWSPDGRTLASGSRDDTIKLWAVDREGGDVELLQTLEGHWSSVNSVAWSPDGRTLASGSWDRTIKLWAVDREGGGVELLQTLEGHEDSVESVAWSPDGRTLASGSSDDRGGGNSAIKLWAVDPDDGCGQLLQTLKDPGFSNVNSVAWSSDGRTLASGSWDNSTIKLWAVDPDDERGQLLQTLEGHGDSVKSVAWSPDGRTLASGSEDRTIKLWAVDPDDGRGQLLQTLEGYESRVLGVAWSPDGRTLASGSNDDWGGEGSRTIKLWAVDSDDRRGQLLQTLEGHEDSVKSVAWSPDGRTLASGSWDGTIKLWAVDSDDRRGQLLQTLEGHEFSVSSVAWSPDGRTLASSSNDAWGGSGRTIKLWAVDPDDRRGQLLQTLKGHESAVSSVAWSPDGRTLASGSVYAWGGVAAPSSCGLWTPMMGAANYSRPLRAMRIVSIAWPGVQMGARWPPGQVIIGGVRVTTPSSCGL